MANKHRADLDKVIEPVDRMIIELFKAHEKVIATRGKIQVQTTEIDQQIDDHYDRLQQQLQQQREELKNELWEVSIRKKKAVSLQLEQIEHSQAQLENMKELNDAIKSGSDQEALFMKKQITEDVKRLTNCYKELQTAPVELANMQFIPAEQYQNWFPRFGNVFHGDADPQNSVAENIPPYAYDNGEVKFTIVTKNAQAHLCTKGGSKVIVQAQLSCSGVLIPVAVKDNQDGSYCASFVTTQYGEVKLSVIINGRHIKGSPHGIIVQRDYRTLDVPSKVIDDGGRMGKPWGIAFGKDGTWAATDSTNHCVYLFDSQDQMVLKFGSNGNGSGEFNCPMGVAFDDNHLYVVDCSNHRVQKFDITSKYLLQFGSYGSNRGQMECPVGITIHNNRVYVTDQFNHYICVFRCDGTFIHTIGQSGQLNQPLDVAVGNNNQLLVADYGHSHISIFTLDGDHVSKFGTAGAKRGRLGDPAGITIDKYGFILITEETNNRVSIFDRDRVFIHCFGSKGSAVGQFSYPHGVALSPNGRIYISDHENKRIQIF